MRHLCVSVLVVFKFVNELIFYLGLHLVQFLINTDDNPQGNLDTLPFSISSDNFWG